MRRMEEERAEAERALEELHRQAAQARAEEARMMEEARAEQVKRDREAAIRDLQWRTANRAATLLQQSAARWCTRRRGARHAGACRVQSLWRSSRQRWCFTLSRGAAIIVQRYGITLLFELTALRDWIM